MVFDPNTDGSRSRPKSTTKWKKTIEPLLNDGDFFQGEGICTQQPQKQIAYLPGTVHGLMEKLKVLLAGFLAGNKITRNEIVGILDELKRRGKISNSEYAKTNSILTSDKT